MSLPTHGLHHVTAISGAAQTNLDFYTRVLGLRLVKRTVNFDDPGTYHLYFGDGEGRPGSLLTFFPWAHAAPGKTGAGMVAATAFSVSEGALDYWIERLDEKDVAFQGPEQRFQDQVLRFEDPDGLSLEMIAHAGGGARSGWQDGPVPAGYTVRSFHSVTLNVRDFGPTAQLLKGPFGYEERGEEEGRLRLEAPKECPGCIIDLVRPTSPEGRMGKGVVHHVAFRARDDEEQQRWRERIIELGFSVTDVRDRQYFRSIYFREPGGVLFEVATDEPGMLIDEEADSLGTTLRLPEWLEPRRDEIEQQLPPLKTSDQIVS